MSEPQTAGIASALDSLVNEMRAHAAACQERAYSPDIDAQQASAYTSSGERALRWSDRIAAVLSSFPEAK